MGYTHYWQIDGNVGTKTYNKALKECRKIIKASPVPLGNAHGKGKPKLNDGIWINGFGDDHYETFSLPKEPMAFNFCKTARMPYDIVVTACLCVIAERLGEYADVSSDGYPEAWEAGQKLASEVLGRAVVLPLKVRQCAGYQEEYRKLYAKEHPEYGPFVPME